MTHHDSGLCPVALNHVESSMSVRIEPKKTTLESNLNVDLLSSFAKDLHSCGNVTNLNLLEATE